MRKGHPQLAYSTLSQYDLCEVISNDRRADETDESQSAEPGSLEDRASCSDSVTIHTRLDKVQAFSRVTSCRLLLDKATLIL